MPECINWPDLGQQFPLIRVFGAVATPTAGRNPRDSGLFRSLLKPWRRDTWCIPQVVGTYVARSGCQHHTVELPGRHLWIRNTQSSRNVIRRPAGIHDTDFRYFVKRCCIDTWIGEVTAQFFFPGLVDGARSTPYFGFERLISDDWRMPARTWRPELAS